MRGVNNVVLGPGSVMVPFESDLLGNVSFSNMDQLVRLSRKPTLSPGATETVLVTAPGLVLQRISVDLTSTTGLLLGGERIYWFPAAADPSPRPWSLSFTKILKTVA